jgi:hypothetical protein
MEMLEELLELLRRELELLDVPKELLKRELELLETLDELLIQTEGGNIAQYASLQVDDGQSGQLLPWGQLNDEELYELLEKLRLELLDGNNEELEALLLGRMELLLTTLLLVARLEVEPLQTDPVTGGRCAGALATPLLPCTPNSTDWPGLIRSFQPMPVAV